MKKIYIILAMLTVLGTLSTTAQNKVIRIIQDGNVLQSYPIEEVDSIVIDHVINAPTGLKATIESSGVVSLSWSEVSNATYDVYRSADNNNYTLIASNIPTNTYIDNSPFAGTNYYKVKARVGYSESEMSATPAIITITASAMESGIYLGITSFNASLYTQPIAILNQETKSVYDNFVDAMTMKNGTVLCYSVDQAINMLQSTSMPNDVSTVALVTFTDGLDQGSLMKDDRYDNDDDYLAAIKNRITSEKIAGKSLTAYSIGLRGEDISTNADISKFRSTLKLLASADSNATEVTNMSEVNAKFQEIAEKLNSSTNIQTVTIKMPGISNGTRVRFTFDNVSSAEKSNLYIEGTFNLKSRNLTDVEYHGMTSSSGTVISGVTEDIFVTFKFEDIQTHNNRLLSMDFISEWYFTSASSWQINSEFDKNDQPDIINEQSSAVIMLVLDCSSSLGSQFYSAKNNAKSFIATLCNSSDTGNGEGDEGGQTNPSLYSTTPTDLTLAISYKGTRYYLTQEEYAKADLSDAIIEGVAVITGDISFIIALHYEPTDAMIGSMAKTLYGDNLPNVSQGKLISARWSYINSAIKAFGGTGLSNSFWTSYYNGCYYYTYNGGGNINYYNSADKNLVRLVYPISAATPIVWRSPYDLNLAVKKNGVIEYYTKEKWNEIVNQSEYEKIGVAVVTDTIKFIIALHNEPTDDMIGSMAYTLYGDNLPNKSQGKLISARWSYIYSAIKAFGGTGLSNSFWTSYYNGCYYYTYNGGGNINYYNSAYKNPVRLVYPFIEPE